MRRLPSAFLVVMLSAAAASPLRAAAAGPSGVDTISLSLAESVRLALERNPRLMETRELVREAGSRTDETRTAFFPFVRGSAGYTRLDVAPYLPTSIFRELIGGSPLFDTFPDRITIGRVDNYSASLGVRQPLFTGGRIGNAHAISRLSHRTAEAELERSSDELVFETKRAYLACVLTEESARLALETVRRLEAQLADVEAMQAVGLAARSDVLKTKVYLSESKLARLRAQNAARLAKNGLCTLLELPLESEIELVSRADSVSRRAIELSDAVRAGLANRPELRQLGFRTRMVEKELEIERNGYLPDLVLFADLSYRYPDREYRPEFYTTWSAGIVAQMNVFDWGRAVYRTRQARSRLRQLEFAAAGLEDAVELDIIRSHLAREEAWSAIAVSSEAVAQAEENFRVTNERFKEGLSTNTELLDAQVLLTKARTELTGAKIAYLVAEADLARAMGTDAY